MASPRFSDRAARLKLACTWLARKYTTSTAGPRSTEPLTTPLMDKHPDGTYTPTAGPRSTEPLTTTLTDKHPDGTYTSTADTGFLSQEAHTCAAGQLQRVVPPHAQHDAARGAAAHGVDEPKRALHWLTLQACRDKRGFGEVCAFGAAR